jgi:NAD(P)-dependent dehydrogenase (short-subunit alcohol dehydrogenase family)
MGTRLAGKVAIVTGAGAAEDGIGNGRAAAILFAREGARVLLVDRKPVLAERTQEMIAAEGGESAAMAADVTSAADCAAMVRAALERWGRLDILQNNVGIGGPGRVTDVDERDWDRVMRVNVTGMMLAAKHAIPAMIESGGGAIVNVSSIAAVRPWRMTPYATSKGAVEALTRGMAADYARDGIRVNCVEPGMVYTPLVYAGGRMSAEERERRRKAAPLGVEGTGWDVGYASLFLVSDEAKFITGVVLPVDGGALLTVR